MELTTIQFVTIAILPILFAISLHEVAHGYVASFFGDYTAKLSGRLSFNPLRHIDPIGTVLVPILMFVTTHFVFGWAKPVPVDARNMRHPRRDMALVALAGPLANLFMAFGWGLIGKIGMWLTLGAASRVGLPLYYMGQFGIIINASLAVLNLLPLPPLDGGRILLSLLPPRIAYHFSQIEPFSFFILLGILLFTNIWVTVMSPPIQFIFTGIMRIFGL